MKKKQSESDKALEEFFNDFIEKQKAEGASPDELATQGNELIRKLMKRFCESALQGEMDEQGGGFSLFGRKK